MQLAPLICVRDVESSSRWYQCLLGCESGHGGSEYERLNSDGRLILQLHNWEVEHKHGRLGCADQPLAWACMTTIRSALREHLAASVSAHRRFSAHCAGSSVLTQGLRRGAHGANEPRSIAKLAGCDGDGS